MFIKTQLKRVWFFRAEDYKYSNAIDYSDEKGLLDDVVVLECLIFKVTDHTKGFVRQRGEKFFYMIKLP
ncbi:hypothetical protein [Chryseobacterium sp. RLHN22]|uniref:hypothetical protein n=1 Tax=Chryseobacterium sp. RLHN22 TaxID=3437885 RepID=UPI003D9BE10E